MKISSDYREFRTNEGWTPLIVAIHHKSERVVTRLLEEGCNPNSCGFKGTTPLMYAKTVFLEDVRLGWKFIKQLLEYGADANRTDCFGRNLLYYVESVLPSDLATDLKDFLENYDSIH